MAEQQKQINFTIVPNEEGGDERPHVYANYCAVGHTPFDFSLTFCQVMPLSEKDIRQAEAEGVVRAPVRVRVVTPVTFIPQLISALQEHWRLFSEGSSGSPAPSEGAGPVH